jgi:nitrite reductase/ring-hydroxylating ferredoxin subunit
VRCACHGSLFALADGTPIEGPASRRIRVYPAVATVAGRLEVEIPILPA